MSEMLPAVEVLGRQALEAKVRANEGAAREWLLALVQIHDRKLYLETHPGWADYVLDTFDYSRSTANRLVAQGREMLALEAGTDDKAAGQRVPRAGHLPSQRQAAKAQKARKQKPIPAKSKPVGTSEGETAGATREPSRDPSDEPELTQVDVDAIGLRWLQSKNDREVRALADPLGGSIRNEVRRWADAFGFTRASGSVTRPEDRVAAAFSSPPAGMVPKRGALGNKTLARAIAQSPKARSDHDPTCRCYGCQPPKVAKG